ncbi:NAD(P)H-quinone oxidoreductase [Tautonia sociabilis]|uniref:NAD(P)H-quinone oxidoreductase n=1 Tax=Tautonia sociabilis TaxID=2080755 RepID=A0A432MPG0_9BACT|nr:NAD(P)H-quinone oxidoreductase [Tautonia sociabilis]RUL88986.1 NAD(P)H-quinone oxidoreductase [Tautonia sociabilis]
MRAVVIARIGGPEALEVRDVPRPEARGDRILVRVRAAGLNRADTLQSRGMYPAPPGDPADIPGLEFAGEVEEKGPDAIGPLRPGDRVFGIVGGGGLAEYVALPERMAVPIPENLDWAAASAVPEAFLTAFDAIDHQAELRSGEAVLIHAVGGGVGSAAVQIAKAMGCPTFGTARTAEKLERLKEYGLDVGIDTSAEDFVAVVRERTDGLGVPAIIDHVGGPYLANDLAALATRGRIVVVGLLGGRKAELDLAALLAKRARIVGTTLRARPIEQKIAVTRRFADRVVPWLARGLVRPIVDRAFPIDQVVEAARHVESNQGFGKVVLTMDP